MKKRILFVFLLCIVGCMSVVFAQTHRRRPARHRTAAAAPRGRRRRGGRRAVVIPPPPPSLPSAPVARPDTTPKKVIVAATPFKKFDRPVDGYYKKNNILNARVKPYPYLREVDVAYSKRIWRDIDLRDKMNQYLASPKARLIDIILEGVASGELTAYDATSTEGSPNNDDPDGDAFAHPLTPAAAHAKLVDSVMHDTFDSVTGDKTGSVLQPGLFNPDSVVRFRIKEDWIFDKQRSVFEPRIIGIAPLSKPTVQGLGAVADYQPAFWIYMPEARALFARKEVSNKHTDASGLSFDDVFVKRIFASYITKQSSDSDAAIRVNFTGIDKLYESERIKKSLQDWEINLWQY